MMEEILRKLQKDASGNKFKAIRDACAAACGECESRRAAHAGPCCARERWDVVGTSDAERLHIVCVPRRVPWQGLMCSSSAAGLVWSCISYRSEFQHPRDYRERHFSTPLVHSLCPGQLHGNEQTESLEAHNGSVKIAPSQLSLRNAPEVSGSNHSHGISLKFEHY
ncbi:hypothetical protein Z043_117362 [Scleropages formosus]|uniref:Uncharacterized protein n=1 Tax=Scleropages formosus TaxID=113540 RepID=A0A0P7U1T5_SCLFO|nr:hypothetical protein Z043_117362 [Scleropages formosus]